MQCAMDLLGQVAEAPLGPLPLLTAVVVPALALWGVSLVRHRLAVAKSLRQAAAKRREAQAAKDRVSERLEVFYRSGGQDKVELRELILGLNVDDLLAKTRSGELLAEDVMCAYMHKALRVSKAINCVCEVFEEAIDQAQGLDRQRAQDPQFATSRDLFGLPVSIKECFRVQGHDATAGAARLCFQTATSSTESPLVKVLRKEGAVPFASTNLPQTMLTYECSNPIYGETVNPADHTRTCGGSSGGEAALQAAGGSLLGLGSDIGGSVRIPAHFCGTCSLKPTAGRLSSEGKVTSAPGQTGVPGTAGIMAQTVRGCELLWQTLQTQQQFDLDPTIPPIPVDQERLADDRKVRIGFYSDDGFFKAMPACQRAIEEVVAAFSGSESIEFVPFSPPNITETIGLYYGLLTADGGATVLEDFMGGEYVDKRIRKTINLVKWPNWLRSLLCPLMRLLPGMERAVLLLSNANSKSVRTLWRLQAKRDKLRRGYIKAMKEAGLDGLLCPASTMTPTKLGDGAELTAACSHTMAFNILDLPSGVVPVTRVTEADDQQLVKNWPRVDRFGHKLVNACRGGVDLPVGVQVVTMPYADELCLNIMARISSACSLTASTSTPQ